MWKIIILTLLFLPLYSQELKVDAELNFVITNTIIKYKNTIVNRPPYLQPTIYLKSSPLYPTLLGLTREISPQVFIIDINILSNNPFIERTILHELIHVRQISSGQLVTLYNGWLWQNKFYSFDSPYESRPWEVEARVLASILTNESFK
jgi:hypothetical protein